MTSASLTKMVFLILTIVIFADILITTHYERSSYCFRGQNTHG